MNGHIIGIAGCGALGSIFAARFQNSGIDVMIFDTDSSTIAAIGNNGLVIKSCDGTVSSSHVTASCDPSILSPCDIIFVFVKTYHLESCLEDIKHHLAENSILVSLQNGIGNDQIIEKYLDKKRIVFGTTAMGATTLGPGSARTGGSGPTIIGGTDRPAVETVHSLLGTAGFDVSVTDYPEQAVWEKAIINSAINPLGAIFNVPNGMLIQNENILSLQQELVSEACAVAQSLGIKLDKEVMIKKTRLVCERTASNLCSMLQDIRSEVKSKSNCCSHQDIREGKKTEIDSINGTIVQAGNRKGIPCPVHSVIIRIIHGLESGNTK